MNCPRCHGGEIDFSGICVNCGYPVPMESESPASESPAPASKQPLTFPVMPTTYAHNTPASGATGRQAETDTPAANSTANSDEAEKSAVETPPWCKDLRQRLLEEVKRHREAKNQQGATTTAHTSASMTSDATSAPPTADAPEAQETHEAKDAAAVALRAQLMEKLRSRLISPPPIAPPEEPRRQTPPPVSRDVQAANLSLPERERSARNTQAVQDMQAVQDIIDAAVSRQAAPGDATTEFTPPVIPDIPLTLPAQPPSVADGYDTSRAEPLAPPAAALFSFAPEPVVEPDVESLAKPFAPPPEPPALQPDLKFAEPMSPITPITFDEKITPSETTNADYAYAVDAADGNDAAKKDDDDDDEPASATGVSSVGVSPAGVSSEGRLILVSRTLAGLLDLVLLAFFTGGFMVAAEWRVGQPLLSSINAVSFTGLALMIYFLYSFFFLLTSRQTLGMMLTGLRVVNMSRSEISTKQAAIRNITFLIALGAGGLGLLMGLFNHKCRCLHDQLSGTCVERV